MWPWRSWVRVPFLAPYPSVRRPVHQDGPSSRPLLRPRTVCDKPGLHSAAFCIPGHLTGRTPSLRIVSRRPYSRHGIGVHVMWFLWRALLAAGQLIERSSISQSAWKPVRLVAGRQRSLGRICVEVDELPDKREFTGDVESRFVGNGLYRRPAWSLLDS